MKTLTLTLVAALTVLLTQTAQARIDKEDRVLLVVSELQTHGPQNLRGLYGVIEDLTNGSTDLVLGDDYRAIVQLRRANATVANFVTRLQNMSKDPSVKAIDVIFSLHGADNKVYFREGGIRMPDLAARLTTVSANMTAAQIATMKKKLRMVYNLSCFGRSHNNDFINMGFDVSVGSRGVNANSEAEFVPALTAWSFGWKFIDSFNASNNDAALAAADTPVRIAGIPADSKKFFAGTTTMTISSDPR